MMTCKSVLLLVSCLIALTSRTTTSAWMQMSFSRNAMAPKSYSANVVGSRVSGFGGQIVYLASEPTTTSSSNNNMLEMKKGKSDVPPMMRKQYEKQKEMMEMRAKMIEASKPGADGLPVFNLYVRTKRLKMWYPCGSFKGDERSAGLAKNYVDKNLLAGISKSQLDNGIAGSLYKDMPKLIDSMCRAYPQLRKSKTELEWGYRLGFAGLDETTEPIVVVEPKEPKGLLDNIKGVFGG